MLLLLVLSVVVVAALLFGANLPPLAMLIAGVVVALVFSLGAFVSTKPRASRLQ